MSSLGARRAARSESAVLHRVKWRGLGPRVARELKHRERYNPIVSAFRWWARRPHTVMGAILDAAIEEYGSAVRIADPFSGGGTVTFEAVRRGVKAYAQDLYPWPSMGLSVATRHCEPRALDRAAERLLEVLAPLREPYRTIHGTELSHVLRVRSADCNDCGGRTFLFPGALVSLKSRSATNTQAFFGCFGCGAISQRRSNVRSFTCGQCGTTWATDVVVTGCAHCGRNHLDRQPCWHPVLVQELVQEGSRFRLHLRPALPGDPVDSPPAGDVHPALTQPIGNGVETRRLLNAGVTQWSDLYTLRQARTIVAAVNAVKQLQSPQAIKDRLAFAVLGAAEMPGFLSRWDRFHLKAFEAMANHRFAHSTLAVEANLLSPVGRGTLPRRLRSAAAALNWLAATEHASPRVLLRSALAPHPSGPWDVLVTTGSSRLQSLPSRSVHIVVTDPPYYDDVQYGELARLLHAWLNVYRQTAPGDESDEAVPNTERGTSAADYEDMIAACLAESKRTLRSNGRLVLTFHNKKLVAWRALGGALKKAGFGVAAIAVVLAENASDHCKRSVSTLLYDLVIECIPARRTNDTPVFVATSAATPPQRNLIAMGLALADFVRSKASLDLAALFHDHLAGMRESRRLIT